MHPLPLASPFTARQATDVGVGAHLLRRWLREGVVRRVLQGVYVDTDYADNFGLRIAAVRLVLRPHCVVTDRTAAWLHGIDTFAYRELEILPPLDVCVLPDSNRIRRKGVHGRSRDLAPGDLLDVDGVRLTTPLRTALDLGCQLGRRDALAALDGFLRLHQLTTSELLHESERFAGRRGVIQLRSLIPLADERAESPGESWTRMAIIDAGLPAPQLQWWVTVDGVPTYRLDAAYPAHRLAIEYDGRAFHDSPEQRAHDEARRRWLRDHGWTVIVVTKDDFTPARLDAWLGEIARILRVR